ncbi:MAG: hypothetical protein HY823_01950 [Acidobacteria bacterium]|nr:hypothetical protein [Acidobacteriota bacterium]
MSAPSRMFPINLLLALIASACSSGTPRSRYVVATDPGSRYNFRYMKDRQSGQWIHIHCEMRVSDQRPLPNPISRPDQGDLLSFTFFTSRSMGSAGIVPSSFLKRDGHKVWLYREVGLPEHLDGTAALSVQVHWPAEGKGSKNPESMEYFRFPGLQSLAPYEWSPWRKADELRGGILAGWEKLQGTGAETGPDGRPRPQGIPSAPAFPFEMRFRVVLADLLVVPIEAEDPNIGRPDPSTFKPPAPPSGRPGSQP